MHSCRCVVHLPDSERLLEKFELEINFQRPAYTQSLVFQSTFARTFFSFAQSPTNHSYISTIRFTLIQPFFVVCRDCSQLYKHTHLFTLSSFVHIATRISSVLQWGTCSMAGRTLFKLYKRISSLIQSNVNIRIQMHFRFAIY